MTTQHKTDSNGLPVDYITIEPALNRSTAKAQALNLSQMLEHESQILENETIITIEPDKKPMKTGFVGVGTDIA